GVLLLALVDLEELRGIVLLLIQARERRDRALVLLVELVEDAPIRRDGLVDLLQRLLVDLPEAREEIDLLDRIRGRLGARYEDVRQLLVRSPLHVDAIEVLERGDVERIDPQHVPIRLLRLLLIAELVLERARELRTDEPHDLGLLVLTQDVGVGVR